MILWPLQVALIARLRGDATLTALLPGGVYSGTVPTGQARPYLTLNVPTEEPFDTFSTYGQTATIQLDTFSATTVKSTQKVDEILDRVEVLLRTPLVVTGFTSPITRREFRTTLVEDDETRHGLVRYRFTASEAA